MKFSLKTPSDVIIEKTAGEFAGIWYDAARSSGMTIVNLQGDTIDLRKYKTPRNFARRHIEKFIPAAVHALTDILSRPETPVEQKDIILNAILERTNDPDIDMLAKTAGDLPAFEQTVLYKPDNEKPKPVIVNTIKYDGGGLNVTDFKYNSPKPPKVDFNFDSKRVK